MRIDYLTYELKYKNDQDVLDLLAYCKELNNESFLTNQIKELENDLDDKHREFTSLESRCYRLGKRVKGLKWWHYFTKKIVLKDVKELLGCK